MNYSRPFLIFILTILCISFVSVQGQETVGGPYTLDDNTIVLLKFDGDLVNASDSTADGIGMAIFSI